MNRSVLVDRFLATVILSLMPIAGGAVSTEVPRTPDFAHCYSSAAQYHGVNEVVLRAIAIRESTENPSAVNINSNGSKDVGVMQINSINLEELGIYGISEKHLWDACNNIYVGAWILRKHIDHSGNTWKAVGRYKSKTPSIRDEYAKEIESIVNVLIVTK
ncbi:lytic transglycosylase domain-containing protein [Limnobacter alexandrii]|uniref:lytic transglycosylase domain-containing protein n=1 Tax=Limnobacter alexandrii TaxID=2570352 RepID=UPI001486645F|nr:lytic transglycosylase domain-containing protein [Limnobacter alexandrii]